jgi:colicin import membrane protein
MSLSEAIHLRSENERKAFVATVIIFLLLLFLLFIWKLSTNVREEFEGGIVVDFGTTETGLGEDNSSLGEPTSGESEIPEPVQQPVTSPVTPTPPTPSVKPVMTADNQEIALEKKKKQEEERLKKEEEQKKKLQAEAEAKAKAEAEKRREKKRSSRKRWLKALRVSKAQAPAVPEQALVKEPESPVAIREIPMAHPEHPKVREPEQAKAHPESASI